jgi:Domain of unknown function (DUF4349)
MRSRRMPMMVLALATVSALGAACFGGGDTQEAGDAGRSHRAPEGAAQGGGDVTGGGGGRAFATDVLSQENDLDSSSQLPAIGPNVIKTADVSVRVEDEELEEAIRRSTSIAEASGGFVVTTSVEDERRGFGSITIRVPADSFGRTLAQLEDLGDVQQEQVSGRDVTQEFVDLEARLRNFAAQEAVLLRLMERSVSVADTIRVQSHLQGVQLEIERLRGRIRYLENQADMSTITLNFAEAGAPAPRTGTLEEAWERAVDASFAVVSAVIVGAGFVFPIALMIGVGFLIAGWVRPRLGSSSS